MIHDIIAACNGNGYMLLLVWLRMQGYSFREIASLLSCSASDVYREMQSIRLYIRP